MLFVQKLYKIGFLSPKGLYHLSRSMLHSSINPILILDFSARMRPNKIALVENETRLSYLELYTQTQALALVLHEKLCLPTTFLPNEPKAKIAILGRNQLLLVKILFATARLGADIYLLNTELSATQILALHQRHSFDFMLYDREFMGKLSSEIPISKTVEINGLEEYPLKNTLKKLPKQRGGKIIVLTGGTSGNFKIAARKSSPAPFLAPFFALLKQVHLDQYERILLPLPLYHGFGLASLIMSFVLGATVYLENKMDALNTAKLIQKEAIEVIVLVPLMWQRLLQAPLDELRPLKCIISGGAPLSPSLVAATLSHFKPILYNLYGTSEAGFCILASPDDLLRHPTTIGKPIRGAKLAILAENNALCAPNTTGRLCVKSNWTSLLAQNKPIDTGDLAYFDENGYYFLCGRADEMIVSGGENVYPIDIENVLLQHPAIEGAAVIAIPDLEFGQRLKAFVVCKDKTMTAEALLLWLQPRLARFQLPKYILFIAEIPVTSLGKPRKRDLG